MKLLLEIGQLDVKYVCLIIFELKILFEDQVGLRLTQITSQLYQYIVFIWTIEL